MVAPQTFTTQSPNNFGYVTLARPTLNVPSFAGFNAVAAAPATGGMVNQVFGVSTSNNALVVVNTDTSATTATAPYGSQRQLFENGYNGVSDLANPTSLVVTGTNGYVIVAGNTTDSHGNAETEFAVFSLNSTTGDLTFVQSDSITTSGTYDSNLSYDSATATLTATGSSGVQLYHVGSNGSLTGFIATTASGTNSTASDSQYSFVANPAANTLTVTSTATGSTVVVAATATNGLLGAAEVAVSNGYVYVVSPTKGTLAVFQETTDPNNPLTFIETLSDGSGGTRGLTNASSVAVTPDGSYVVVASSTGNTLAAFQRNTDGTLDSNDTVYTGNGLTGAAEIAVDNNYVYVASPSQGTLAVFQETTNPSNPLARDSGSQRRHQ